MHAWVLDCTFLQYLHEIYIFYKTLGKAKAQCKSDEINIIMGDLNARAGRGQDGKAVGEFGAEERNERGDRWVEWCEADKMVIMNTWFKEHPKKIYTWKIPGDRLRNQIDYLSINHRFQRAVKQRHFQVLTVGVIMFQ